MICDCFYEPTIQQYLRLSPVCITSVLLCVFEEFKNSYGDLHMGITSLNLCINSNEVSLQGDKLT